MRPASGASPSVPAHDFAGGHLHPVDPQDRPPFEQIGTGPSCKTPKKLSRSSTPTFVAAAITIEKGPKC